MKSFIVCATYRPPDTPLSYFNSDLTENIIYASSFNVPVYLLGDLNCRLEKSNNPEAKVLINFCRSYNLSILINTPTRVTETSKSILDVILASDTKQVQKATVMENSISDHDLVYVTLTLFRLGFFGQSVTGGGGGGWGGGSSDPPPPSVSLEPIMLGS